MTSLHGGAYLPLAVWGPGAAALAGGSVKVTVTRRSREESQGIAEPGGWPRLSMGACR